jgi:hypothetical protein
MPPDPLLQPGSIGSTVHIGNIDSNVYALNTATG